MIVVIAGSRYGFTYTDVENFINKVLDTYRITITEIICGDAIGVDTFGRLYGEKYNIPVRRMPADWDKFGKRAGYLRNKEMVDIADAVIALIYNDSVGTINTVDIANTQNKPTYVLNRRTIT